MSTAIPGEVWRPTSAEQVQHLGLVEETGNQGDFSGRAYRRSSKNVRGNDPKCEGPTTGVSQEVTAPTFTGIRVVQKHLSTCCEKTKLHAYRISVVHELKQPDQVKRVAYCRWFQTLLK